MPGEFFVMEWSRSTATYILHVDDEKGSSYSLGSDYTTSRQLFRLWRIEDVGARAFDMAREFGLAQAIPEQDRVIALIDRDTKAPLNWKSKGRTHALPRIDL